MTDFETGRADWFAVQVRARWEQSTAKILLGKGYDILLPLHQSRKQSGDRSRGLEVPLFPGYVFCRFDVLKRLPILVTPGVQAIVSRGRVPIPVELSEIRALQTIVAAGAQAEPWPYLEVGERVRIEEGVLRGMEGILVGVKNSHRVVVSISLLQRSVALEINRMHIKPLRETGESAEAGCLAEAVPQGVLA